MTFYSNRTKKRDPYKAIEREAFDSVRDKCRENIDLLYSLDAEILSVRSHDGLTLKARFFRGKNDKIYHLMFHGYKSTPYLDFMGGATDLIRRGENVILVDQRAHGDSEGKTICFGAKERRDVHTWIKHTEKLFGEDIKIFLWGVSMGAATVLSSLEFPHSDSVVGVIADCPFSSPLGIITLVANKMGLPRPFVPLLMRPAAVVCGGFRLGKREARRAVMKSKLPILLIHGDADTFVPSYMSDEIYKAAVDAGVDISYHVFPNADHAMSYLSDKERYISLVDGFIAKCLDEK